MNGKELNEKVALLKAGQRVEIDGLIFTAKQLHLDDDREPCQLCKVNCLLFDNVNTVCACLEKYGKSEWYLNLEV